MQLGESTGGLQSEECSPAETGIAGVTAINGRTVQRAVRPSY